MEQERTGFVEQEFDYFLALDFEATCLKGMKIVPQEIIEVPCIKICARTFKVLSEFHSFVRPVFRPRLSPFCSRLTGIRQHQVDRAPEFAEVYSRWLRWLAKEGVNSDNSVFLTCGDWDLATMLPAQIRTSGMVGEGGKDRRLFKRWVNVKEVFEAETGTRVAKSENYLLQVEPSIQSARMLWHFGLEHTGRLHSGRDDSASLAAVARELARTTKLRPTNKSTTSTMASATSALAKPNENED